MGKQVERIVNAERVEDLIAVFGSFDENIKRIEEALDVHQGTTECVLIAQRSSIDEIRQKAHDQIVKSIIFKRKVFSHELQ